MNQKLAEARILAARKMPYMTHQVMTLIPVERPGLGTMAVDEYCRLYFDPAFLEGRDLKHLAFVVLHEAIHVWSRHAKRCRALAGRETGHRIGWGYGGKPSMPRSTTFWSNPACAARMRESRRPSWACPGTRRRRNTSHLLLERAKQEEEQQAGKPSSNSRPKAARIASRTSSPAKAKRIRTNSARSRKARTEPEPAIGWRRAGCRERSARRG